MKLDIKFSRLDALIKIMGAAHSQWRPGQVKLSARQILRRALAEGKEVSADQVGVLGSLLEHEGEQILLYIKDTRSDLDTLRNEPEKSRKFHIAECSTLEEMRRNNRFPRYHATSRLDGKFNCSWIDRETGKNGEVLAELSVCKNCLKEIAWKGYATSEQETARNDIVRNFYIAEFLRTYETLFYSYPDKTASTPVTATYVQEWERFQKRLEKPTHGSAASAKQIFHDLSIRNSYTLIITMVYAAITPPSTSKPSVWFAIPNNQTIST